MIKKLILLVIMILNCMPQSMCAGLSESEKAAAIEASARKNRDEQLCRNLGPWIREQHALQQQALEQQKSDQLQKFVKDQEERNKQTSIDRKALEQKKWDQLQKSLDEFNISY